MKDLKSSVHKTFAILEYFTTSKKEWGVTELAHKIGSNKSTVYRFLSDLNKLGVLYKDEETEKYSLGLKLFELGSRVHLKSAMVEKTHPELIEVAKQIKETVHIAILKDSKIFHIDKSESPQGLKLSSHIGSYGPVHSTALGKILAANLSEESKNNLIQNLYIDNKPNLFTINTITKPKDFLKELNLVKKHGYAIDMEESEIGLICVAVPIYNQNEKVIASLSASGPASRFKSENVTNYVSILNKGANAIKKKIGFFKP